MSNNMVACQRHRCAPDVALADEHARVVDGLGQALLEDQGLQAALQEVSGRQRQHVIQLVLALVQQAVPAGAKRARVSRAAVG